MMEARFKCLSQSLLLVAGLGIASCSDAQTPGLACFEVVGNKPQGIVEACSQAIESGAYKKERLGEAYFNRGFSHYFLEDYEAAIDDYSEALKRLPKNANVFSNRGAAFKKALRLEEALDDFTRAVELDPNFANGHTGRGDVLYLMGRNEDAVKAYAQALLIDPADDTALHNLSLVHKDMKKKAARR